MRRKGELPEKVCPVCGRPFTWRRKWARDWDAVRYCSDRCRRKAKRTSRLPLALVGVVAAIAAAPATVWGDGPAVPRCHTRQLRVTLTGVPGGLDHLGTAIVFANEGSRCAIDGYPGWTGSHAMARWCTPPGLWRDTSAERVRCVRSSSIIETLPPRSTKASTPRHPVDPAVALTGS